MEKPKGDGEGEDAGADEDVGEEGEEVARLLREMVKTLVKRHEKAQLMPLDTEVTDAQREAALAVVKRVAVTIQTGHGGIPATFFLCPSSDQRTIEIAATGFDMSPLSAPSSFLNGYPCRRAAAYFFEMVPGANTSSGSFKLDSDRAAQAHKERRVAHRCLAKKRSREGDSEAEKEYE